MAEIVKRKHVVLATAVALAVVTAPPAAASPGTTLGKLTYLTSGIPNSGTLTRDGCGAKKWGKTDRVRTISYDTQSNNSNIVCAEVGARAYVYAGTGGYWTSWDTEWDAAVVFVSVYQTSQHSLNTIGAAWPKAFRCTPGSRPLPPARSDGARRW